MIAQPATSRTSPVMSASTKNSFAGKSGLGSTSNLSVQSANLRSSTGSRNSHSPTVGSRNSHSPIADSSSNKPAGQKPQSRFGLNASKQHSLSKSNLNGGSTLNRSSLNLHTNGQHTNGQHTNTLPGLVRPGTLKSSNLPTHLSGSSSQLADPKRASLIRQQKHPTTATSCLPAPKSRPTSALLPDGLSKRGSKLLNGNSNSRTSSNLNLNAEPTNLKPLGTLKPATTATTKDSGFNALKKRPAPSNSIKSTMQNLSQSSSNSMIYKPYSSLTNRLPCKPKLNAKDAKIDVKDKSDLIDGKSDKFDKTDDRCLINSQTTYRAPTPDKADRCNIARVSPIRRQYSISANIKRPLNGSLNSSDQDDELDDELFDSENTLNQPTSEDSHSFNSEEARYFAVLSSSEDEKLIGGPRRSREREEKRLRRASGQRSGSSKRSSPKRTTDAKLGENKTSTPVHQSSSSKLMDPIEKQPNEKEADLSSPPPTPNQPRKRSASSLNKSSSSSNYTIDHKSSTLNDLFPTLNRLHNSGSIQALNSPKSATAAKPDEQDYQSDDAEITLYKLKSLDFSCNSSAAANGAEKSPGDKDGNNNSLNNNSLNNNSLNNNSLNMSSNGNSTLTNFDPPNGQLNSSHHGKQINGDCSTGEFGVGGLAAPGLSSLFSNYMSRSIGSLTGSLSKLNSSSALNNNWSNQAPANPPCSTPPPLQANFRSKSPNVISSSNVYQSILTPTFQSIGQPYSSLLSSPSNTVITNHVQNTTILNNVPTSFTSRLSKCGENRGSSLSLLSACSSNYSNNLSINSNQTYQQQRSSTSSGYLEKGALNEIKQLRNELNRANEKINLLKSQLVTSGQMVNSFEQSLQTKTARMKHYVLQLEEKDREIDHLKQVIENLRKTYGFSLADLNLTTVNYRNESFNLSGSNLSGSNLNESMHQSRSLHNSSDGESGARSKSKTKEKKAASKKRSHSKKSRANSAHTSDDDDTVSLASVHSKDGSGWFKNSFTRAFRKKSSRSKHGSNQELDKTGDLNDSRHPQHPSQLHQSYIKQDSFRQELYKDGRDGELLAELKAQLSEKEKCLTDERLRSLSREDEMMKLKECLNCLQQELFSLRSQTMANSRAD